MRKIIVGILLLGIGSSAMAQVTNGAPERIVNLIANGQVFNVGDCKVRAEYSNWHWDYSGPTSKQVVETYTFTVTQKNGEYIQLENIPADKKISREGGEYKFVDRFSTTQEQQSPPSVSDVWNTAVYRGIKKATITFDKDFKMTNLKWKSLEKTFGVTTLKKSAQCVSE